MSLAPATSPATSAQSSARLFRLAGWSACLSAALSIISGILLVLFYGLEVPQMTATDPSAPQTFGTLNDIATVFQFLCVLPLVAAFHRLTPSDRRGVSRIGVAIGVVGLVGVVIAQALLVVGVLSFDVNLPVVMAAYGLFGLWVVLANQFARASGALSRRLALLGMFTGIAFILMSVLVLLVELINWRDPSAMERLATFFQQNPALAGAAVILVIPLALAWFVAVPLWLIGVGRRLFALPSAR